MIKSIIEKGANYYYECFGSLKELSEALNSRPYNKGFLEKKGGDISFLASNSTESGDRCTSSFNEADKLMLEGDYERCNMIRNEQMRIDAGISDKKSTLVKSCCGSFPCVPLYLSGCPKNMYSKRMYPDKARTVSIIIETQVSIDVSSEKIIKAGAEILTAISILERNGIRINLFAADYSYTPKGKKVYNLAMIVKLKDAGSPLDKLSVSYPIAHPSFLRRHFLRFVETCECGFMREYSSCYGVPGRIKNTGNFVNTFCKNPVIITMEDIIRFDSGYKEIVNKVLSKSEKQG